MDTFRELIEQWPTRIAFAAAVSTPDLPVSPVLASAWWQRDNIPPVYWPHLIEACRKRADLADLTRDRLAQIAVRRDTKRRAAVSSSPEAA